MQYNYQKFEQDIKRLQPRAFDTYILPAFMIYFALKSRDGAGKIARRMLFSAGCYMIYKNYFTYKKTLMLLTGKTKELIDKKDIAV